MYVVRFTLLIACLIAFTTGCSPTSGTSTMTFEFATKNNGAFNVGTPEMVIINITGPDNEDVFFERDCQEFFCGLIELDVPAGKDRLIQVLAVSRKADGERLINYGDYGMDLTNGINEVPVTISTIASFKQEARWVGRYIPTANHPLAGQKLTGWADVKFDVGVGKPSMKVSTFEVFGGWFNTFLIDGVPFKFVFRGYNEQGTWIPDTPMFSDLHGAEGITLNHNSLSPFNAERVHYEAKPGVTFFDREDNGYLQKDFRKKIVGFFGQNPSNQRLCARQLSPSTLLDGRDGRSHMCKLATVGSQDCSQYMRWGDIQVSNNGPDGSTNSCFGVPAAEQFEVNLAQIGEDEADFLSFYGPFKLSNSQTGQELFNVNFGTNEIEWNVADGVYLPAGIEVFAKLDLATFFDDDLVRERGEGIRCEDLNQYGFQSLGVSLANPGRVSFDPNWLDQSGFALALCARTPKGGYYRTAHLVEVDDVQGFEPGEPSDLRISPLAIDSDGLEVTYYVNRCYPVELAVTDGRGNKVGIDEPEILEILGIDDAEIYGTRDDCIAGTLNLVDNDTFNFFGVRVLFVKPITASQDFGFTIRQTSSSAVSLSSSTFSKNADAGTAPAIDLAFRLVPNQYRPNKLEAAESEECVPFAIESYDRNTGAAAAPGGAIINFAPNFTDDSSIARPVQVYSSQTACQADDGVFAAGLTSLNLTTVVTNVFIGFEKHEGRIDNFFDLGMAACMASPSPCDQASIDIVAPGEAEFISFDFNGGLFNGSCTPVDISPRDYDGYPTKFGGDDLRIRADSGAPLVWHSDPLCSSPLGSDIDINASIIDDQTMHSLWVQPASTGFSRIRVRHLNTDRYLNLNVN